MSAIIHFPENHIGQLADRFGGLTREEAVAAATRQLETMRPEADQEIETAVAQMEDMIAVAAKSEVCVVKLLQNLLPPCDQIVTLAGTYAYIPLDKAARSLCDLLDELLRLEKNDSASIRVHVQTIRLLMPGAALLAAEQVDLMLSELAKVLAHQGIAKSGAGANGGRVGSATRGE